VLVETVDRVVALEQIGRGPAEPQVLFHVIREGDQILLALATCTDTAQ
jgi:hypothetical protein